MVFASRVGGHIAFHSKEMVFRHNGTIYDFHFKCEGERERICFRQQTIFSIADSRIENSYNGVEEVIERVVTTIRILTGILL